VGVFRDEQIGHVAAEAARLGLAAVQLHGAEDEAYIDALRRLLPEDVEIWGAQAVGPEVPEGKAGADRLLFDTEANGRSGGTGMTFDWKRVDGREELKRAVLAGGLNPTNAAAASNVGAYALDVSSGVEASPGTKDPEKLKQFFEALRVPVRGEVQPC
jgi:indole-3-glycerol phosphate synthase/phosphoribosylanthranilate isomerase